MYSRRPLMFPLGTATEITAIVVLVLAKREFIFIIIIFISIILCIMYKYTGISNYYKYIRGVF